MSVDVADTGDPASVRAAEREAVLLAFEIATLTRRLQMITSARIVALEL